MKKCGGETYSLDNLKTAWTRFLESTDLFHQKQLGGHGVRYFANNVNSFIQSGKPRQSREERLREIEQNIGGEQ